MTNGGLSKIMPRQVCLRGHDKDVKWSSFGSVLRNCDGAEFRHRCHSVKYKVHRGRGKLLVIAGKKKKLIDITVTRSVTYKISENLSNQSGAAPAADMEMMSEIEEDEVELEEQEDEFSRYRGLVLDVAYRPINVVNWQRALCLDILEKAEVLEYYDQVIYSPSKMFFIPAVLKVAGLIHNPRHKQVRLTLNRKNIFLRDKYKCQYCNANENLTIDHVFAASRGGGWTWDNLVTACSPCNVKKASKTLEEARMTLIKTPKEPKLMENLPPNFKTFRTLKVHQKTPLEWISYLPGTISMFQ